MEKIFSSTALRDRQAAVKKAAREGIVRITENGNGAFVFCSDEVFEREMEHAVEEALYAQRAADVVMRGREDYAAGRYVTDAQVARARVAKMRDAHD